MDNAIPAYVLQEQAQDDEVHALIWRCIEFPPGYSWDGTKVRDGQMEVTRIFY